MAIRTRRFSTTRAGIKLACSLAVLSSVIAAPQVFSQDDDDMVEEVLVQGVRRDLMNAQELKRNSDTFVDAITAEDIGSLPDRSVLEAIQRLPGVSVERFAGPDDPDHFSVEGSGVLIRGLTQTRSEFNGRDSFSASTGRGLSFQDVSPELMGSVEVFKNQTASMIEGGIGGTITLNTRKPFDQDDRMISISADYSYGDLAEKGSPTISALFSDRWETDAGEFGFLISFADSKLWGESHGIQSDAFLQYHAGDLAGAERFNADGDGIVWIPNGVNALTKEDERDRQGLSTAFQWRSPDETLLATVEYIRSDSSLSWHEQAIKYQSGYQTLDTRQGAPLAGTEFAFNDDGLFQAGTLVWTDGWRTGDGNQDHVPRAWGDNSTGQWGHKVQLDSRVVDSSSLVEDISFNLEWQISDQFTLELDIQHIEAEGSNDDLVVHTGTFAGFDYETRLSTPTATFLEPWFGQRDANPDAYQAPHPALDGDGNPLYPNGYPGFTGDPAGDSNYFQDPNNYFWRSAMDHYERSNGESNAFRLDGTYEFEGDSLMKAVKAGVRYAKREQTVRRTGWNWGSVMPEFSSAATAGWLPNVSEQSSDWEYVDWSDFHGGGVVNIEGNQTIHATPEFVRSLMGASPARQIIMSSASSWEPYPTEDGVDSQYGLFTPGDINLTTEVSKSAYVQLDFASTGDLQFSGNIGLRYVTLDREALGAIQFPDLLPENEIPASTGLQTPLTRDALLTYVDQQIANGTYEDLAAFSADEANEWAGDVNNYLTADESAFGNNQEFPQVAVSDFDAFLPSFNIKLELTDELIARFAVSKAIALPDIGDVRNRLTLGTLQVERVNYGDTQDPIEPGVEPPPGYNLIESARIPGWTGSGGNPFLEPMESIQYDFSLEWYFADVGQLTGTIFHKNLKNYFIQGASQQILTNPSNGLSRVVDVDRTINGGGAKIDGIELAYQYFFRAAYLDGFGVAATYTYVDAVGTPNNELDVEKEGFFEDVNTDTGIRVSLDRLPLQGQSRQTINLIGMYDKNDWSARLAYNWRSRYLLTTRDVISKAPLFNDDHGQLDASVFYNINDNFKVGFQFTNLTNSQSKTIMVLNDELLEAGRTWFIADRRVSFKVQASF